MTEAHDWPRYPFAVGEPVNTRCCVCGERFTVPRPANAGYPWDAQCTECKSIVGVCENAISAYFDAIERQHLEAAWEKRKADERIILEAQRARKEARALEAKEQAKRAAVLDAAISGYADRLGRHVSRNEFIYLESQAGVPHCGIAELMDLSRSRINQIVSGCKGKLAQQRRKIRCRAHLAQCIEPTPNQRDVWHEYRIEDAYRA